MRRRSERKKSTQSPPPASASRRTRRTKKSSQSPESEKHADSTEPLNDVQEQITDADSNTRASSEEIVDSTRRSRGHNPLKRLSSSRSTPSRRKGSLFSDTPAKKLDTIVDDENNGAISNDVDDGAGTTVAPTPAATEHAKDTAEENVHSSVTEVTSTCSPSASTKDDAEEDQKDAQADEEVQDEEEERCTVEQAEDDNDAEGKEHEPEVRKSSSSTELVKTLHEQKKDENDECEEGEVFDSPKSSNDKLNEKKKEISLVADPTPSKNDANNEVSTADTIETPQRANESQAIATPQSELNSTLKRQQRRRKWVSKRTASPIMAITTDSLKEFIADVQPVPLSDVHLESSSEVEAVSEREEGEDTSTDSGDDVRRLLPKDKPVETITVTRTFNNTIVNAASSFSASANVSISNNVSISSSPVVIKIPDGNTDEQLQRAPSPARNKSSNVLYITNLVRPFTVLQLKSLLARTGKIVDPDGFWIDRIKSKCYVEYENEDEAIETRHALHGVRWPLSNPKCLNVDFGYKSDMERLIAATKDEAPKFGQENAGWNRDQNNADDRKRPVREWDVGKKDTFDRQRDRERDRERDRDDDRNERVGRRRSRESSANRENERDGRDRSRRDSRGKDFARSRSVSPVRKQKKKDEPPLRLLDDLFRKTKALPSIYWLPLTPEQIAEKESLRQQRIERAQQDRIKEREEREKERERDRLREKERDKEREKDRDKEREKDRDKDRDHKRSREKDREPKRSREKDREHKRSHEKERERSREKERGKDRERTRDRDKDRSRGRDRSSKRTRSNERRKSRSRERRRR